MSQPSAEQRALKSIPSKLHRGVCALLEAFEYSDDVGGDRWEFAVAIRHLKKLDCSKTDLRWLVRKGYVEHAREVTPQGDNGRQFRSTGDLTFSKSTCFMLTEIGASKVRSVVGNQLIAADTEARAAEGNRHVDSNSLPDWDPEARILYVDGKIAKRFKRRAANQEAILSAFQEDGWPQRVDNPLPPQPEQDSKRRLSDTIKCLNKHTNQLIRFHGDGTGEGVTWERVEPHDEPDAAD